MQNDPNFWNGVYWLLDPVKRVAWAIVQGDDRVVLRSIAPMDNAVVVFTLSDMTPYGDFLLTAHLPPPPPVVSSDGSAPTPQRTPAIGVLYVDAQGQVRLARTGSPTQGARWRLGAPPGVVFEKATGMVLWSGSDPPMTMFAANGGNGEVRLRSVTESPPTAWMLANGPWYRTVVRRQIGHR